MSCLFCSLYDAPELHTRPEDEILDETETLYLKPALGAFVEGYSLIITKDHKECFARVEPQVLSEFIDLKQKVSAMVSTTYSTLLLTFEHGIIGRTRSTGSCIDHAHAHLIPSAVDVVNQLKHQYQWIVIGNYHQLASVAAALPSYLLYESVRGELTVFQVPSDIPSQFLRRVMCNALGKPNQWDWRLHPFTEEINRFKVNYRAFRQSS